MPPKPQTAAPRHLSPHPSPRAVARAGRARGGAGAHDGHPDRPPPRVWPLCLSGVARPPPVHLALPGLPAGPLGRPHPPAPCGPGVCGPCAGALRRRAPCPLPLAATLHPHSRRRRRRLRPRGGRRPAGAPPRAPPRRPRDSATAAAPPVVICVGSLSAVARPTSLSPICPPPPHSLPAGRQAPRLPRRPSIQQHAGGWAGGAGGVGWAGEWVVWERAVTPLCALALG